MTTKNNILQFMLPAFIAAAGLLTACSSDDDTPEKQPLLLTVEVAEQPINSDDPAQTRTTITESGDLKEFILHGNHNSTKKNYSFVFNGSSWAVSGNTSSWPITDETQAVSFYAHTNDGVTYTEGQSYVSFTQAEDAFNQYDLLAAYTSTAYNDKNGCVSLNFKHACAAVKFNLYMSNTLKTYLGQSKLYVTSVKLCNVNKTGRYAFENNTWSNLSTLTSFTLNSSESLEIPTEGNLKLPEAPSGDTSTHYLFMIPQEKSDASIEVTYKKGNESSNTVTYPLSVNWVAGTPYLINIKLTKSDLFPNP